MRHALIGLIFLLFSNIFAAEKTIPQIKSTSATSHDTAWAQVEDAFLPIRTATSLQANIIGMAQRGDYCQILARNGSWIKLKAHDTLIGWSLGHSVNFVNKPNPQKAGQLNFIITIVLGLISSTLFLLGFMLHRSRKKISEDKVHKISGEKRLQNKILLLFPFEPLVESELVNESVSLFKFLEACGYECGLENQLDNFFASYKTFSPNLLVADFIHYEILEKLMGENVRLINTPIIYVNTAPAETPVTYKVRQFLPTPLHDKPLRHAITQCLEPNSQQLLYSIQSAALKGNIQAGTLLDLILFLAQLKKSGRLLVVGSQDAGEIILYKGLILEAVCSDSTEREAVEKIIQIESGHFEFLEEKTKKVSKKTFNAEEILLNWAKSKDEKDHPTGT